MAKPIPTPDSNNAWRLATPGVPGWPRSARPGAANKYFMVSTDGHVQEPSDLWRTRIDAKYRDRLPGVVVDASGNQLQKTEGFRPLRLSNVKFEGEDLLRNQSGKTPMERLADLEADGVECEVLFPNKGLTIWATPDAQFSQAMCRVYNDPVSRYGVRLITKRRTTTCPSSIRCGPASRTWICPSRSTSPRDATRARRAATAVR